MQGNIRTHAQFEAEQVIGELKDRFGKIQKLPKAKGLYKWEADNGVVLWRCEYNNKCFWRVTNPCYADLRLDRYSIAGAKEVLVKEMSVRDAWIARHPEEGAK